MSEIKNFREINSKKLLKWSQELQAISTSGLFYTKDPFDKERFEQIKNIASDIAGNISDMSCIEIKELFDKEYIYQTPKIDSRAVIFNDNDEVLLIEENNHTWSTPGGWCEYNLSPAKNAVKEAKEEAGVNVTVKRLVAVHDQRIHNSPYKFFSVMRFLYLCDIVDGEFVENIETLRSGWFKLDNLPQLASEKCSAKQLELCLNAKKSVHWETDYD